MINLMETPPTRKSLDELRGMKKKLMLSSIQSFLANYDNLRYKYCQMQLENNYLERRIEMLESRIKDLQSLLGSHRIFKHYSKRDYNNEVKND